MDDDNNFLPPTVDGKATYEYAASHKDDLDVMLKCCAAEMRSMRQSGMVAAPFYFERAAVLLKRKGAHAAEIALCREYLDALEQFYAGKAPGSIADVRRGPRVQAIRKRLEKATSLRRGQAEAP